MKTTKLFFLIVILAIVSAAPLRAQWVQTNGPYDGDVRCFAVSGTNLFAGTDVGVFLSTNNGTSWAAVNTGLTFSDIFALAVSGTNLFAGTRDGGIYLSQNNGTSWAAINTGLTGDALYVRSLVVSA